MDPSSRNRRRQSQKALVLRFALCFFTLVLLFSVAVWVDKVLFHGSADRTLSESAAWVVVSLMALLGAKIMCVGNTISYGSTAFDVIPECTGIDVVWLFVAAVLAFPSRWRDKLTGVAMGVLVLTGLNLIRIVTLVLVGARWPDGLEYGHLYVWPAIVLAAGVGMWLSWAGSVSGDSHLLA